jgi:hypothetical protein
VNDGKRALTDAIFDFAKNTISFMKGNLIFFKERSLVFMSRSGGPLIDSETGGAIATVVAIGLGLGAAIGLAYQAGTDVSERILRQHRKDKREFERKERIEQKEKKKEERRNRRLEWWKTVFPERNYDREDY